MMQKSGLKSVTSWQERHLMVEEYRLQAQPDVILENETVVICLLDCHCYFLARTQLSQCQRTVFQAQTNHQSLVWRFQWVSWRKKIIPTVTYRLFDSSAHSQRVKCICVSLQYMLSYTVHLEPVSELDVITLLMRTLVSQAPQVQLTKYKISLHLSPSLIPVQPQTWWNHTYPLLWDPIGYVLETS